MHICAVHRPTHDKSKKIMKMKRKRFVSVDFLYRLNNVCLCATILTINKNATAFIQSHTFTHKITNKKKIVGSMENEIETEEKK